MTTYTVKNTAGATIATIPVATTTGTTFPIELLGQGISLYGKTIAETEYHLLENFANIIPPTNPVTGMSFYNTAKKEFSYYDGSGFVGLSSLASNAASLFPMLPAATGIDLTTTGSTIIFTDPNTGGSYHATGLLLKVSGTPTLATPALLNLKITTSEDVMENVSVNLTNATQHGYYIIQGTTMFATGGASISLEVVVAATSSLIVDAHLFGFTT